MQVGDDEQAFLGPIERAGAVGVRADPGTRSGRPPRISRRGKHEAEDVCAIFENQRASSLRHRVAPSKARR